MDWIGLDMDWIGLLVRLCHAQKTGGFWAFVSIPMFGYYCTFFILLHDWLGLVRNVAWTELNWICRFHDTTDIVEDSARSKLF